MKCPVCGNKMTTKRESFNYKASGLPGVTLMGVEVSRCENCGEYEVAIPALDDLHRTIARELIKKPRLNHNEFRFLRKHLGRSGADFARMIGAAPETVSRWERGTQSFGLKIERLLKLMVVIEDAVPGYSIERLLDETVEARKRSSLRLQLDGGTWRPSAAA